MNIFQSGMALAIENANLLQEVGRNQETMASELVGTSSQLSLINSAAEVSIRNMARGIKALGLLISTQDRNTGTEAEILAGIDGLLQEVGDGINVMLEVMTASREGWQAALVKESGQARTAPTPPSH